MHREGFPIALICQIKDQAAFPLTTQRKHFREPKRRKNIQYLPVLRRIAINEKLEKGVI